MSQPIHTGPDARAYLHAANLSVFGDACLIPREDERCDICLGTGEEQVIVRSELIEFEEPLPCDNCGGSGEVAQ